MIDCEQGGGGAAAPSFMAQLRKFGVHETATRDRKSLVWVDAKCKEDNAFTYGEVVRRAAAVAKALANKWSCGSGDKILLVFFPGLEFLVAFLGCLMAGMVAVPIYPPNPRNPAKGMKILLAAVRMTEPKVALSHGSFMLAKRLQFKGPSYPNDLPFHSISKLGGLDAKGTVSVMQIAIELWAAPGRLALIQFSSGSTGDPKPVALSAANLDANLFAATTATGTNTQSVGVTWIPVYHDGGLIGSCCGAFYGGAVHVMTSPLIFLGRPAIWMEMISKYRATITFMPNFALEMCINKVPASLIPKLDISSCTNIMVGAEPVRSSTLRRFVERFKACGARLENMSPGLGAAENGVMISIDADASRAPLVLSFSPDSLQVGSEVQQIEGSNAVELVGNGPVVVGTALCVVNPDTLERMDEAQVGELWLSGTSRAVGYFRRPDINDSVFDVALAESPEAKVHYRTGDIGFILDDQVFVCGRLKDMLIINGKNYFPQDIEHATELGAPKHVRPGCVAAFAISDVVRGTEAAVVVAEVRDEKSSDLYEVAMAVKASVATNVQVQVQDVVFIQQRTIPKTTSGKIKRKQAKADLAAGKLKVIMQIRNSELLKERATSFAAAEVELSPEEWLCLRAAQVLDVREVRPDDDLFELGLTSMGVMTLTDALETLAGGSKSINNPDAFFQDNSTVAAMLHGLEALSSRTQTKEGMDRSLPPVKLISSTQLGPVVMPLLEMLGLCVIWVLIFVAVLPPYHFLHWVFFTSELPPPWRVVNYGGTFSTFGFLAMLAIPMWMVAFSFLVIVLKWITVGRYRDSVEIPLWSMLFLRWWVVDRAVHTWEVCVGFFISDTPLLNMWFKLMGSSCAMSAKCEGFYRDFDLVSVDERAVVSGRVFARVFDAKRQVLRFRKTCIASDASIRGSAVVAAGARIAHDTRVLNLCAIPEGGVTMPCSVYEGAPAFRSSRTHSQGSSCRHPQRVGWVKDLVVKVIVMLVSLFMSMMLLHVAFFFWALTPSVEGLRYTGHHRLLPLFYWVGSIYVFGVLFALSTALMKRLVFFFHRGATASFLVDFQWKTTQLAFLQFFNKLVILPGALLRAHGVELAGSCRDWPLFVSSEKLNPSLASGISVGRFSFISSASWDSTDAKEMKTWPTTAIGDDVEVGLASVVEVGARAFESLGPLAVHRVSQEETCSEVHVDVDSDGCDLEAKRVFARCFASLRGLQSDPELCLKLLHGFGFVVAELESLGGEVRDVCTEPQSLDVVVEGVSRGIERLPPLRDFVVLLDRSHGGKLSDSFRQCAVLGLHCVLLLDALTQFLVHSPQKADTHALLFKRLLERAPEQGDQTLIAAMGHSANFEETQGMNGRAKVLAVSMEATCAQIGSKDKLAWVGARLAAQLMSLDDPSAKPVRAFWDAFIPWNAAVVALGSKMDPSFVVAASALLLPRSGLLPTQPADETLEAQFVAQTLVTLWNPDRNILFLTSEKPLDPAWVESLRGAIFARSVVGVGTEELEKMSQVIPKLHYIRSVTNTFSKVLRAREEALLPQRGLRWSLAEEFCLTFLRVAIMLVYVICLAPSFLFAVWMLYGEPFFWQTNARSSPVASRDLAIVLLFPTIPMAAMSLGLFMMLFTFLTLGHSPSKTGKMRLRAGVYCTYQQMTYALQRVFFFVYGSSLNRTWHRILGSTVGKDAFINGLALEPPFLEFGDESVVDGAIIFGHMFAKGKLHDGKTRIGARSTLHPGSIAFPNTQSSRFEEIGSLTLTTRQFTSWRADANGAKESAAETSGPAEAA
ncbi:Long-chain-fatty-acid--AMP ligase FadD28 (Acyl-AMP synthetase) (Long-chain fatty acid adenylyltransferase FadD28) [Durusdinium trenchii]|uniref:Long-chain-fatty-acid--AMP ligase FadD28 (Acyl-AMP synthetase) (Long-chain fatty acid adenylyltransferase FadD28) n=1 Tax=Durusdinium trenchii TaxID=1381693 RepID=A0ABP0J8G1_9DINO